MSNTEIYAVNLNGEITFIEEVENSNRGAIHVWNSLCEKYEIKGDMIKGVQKLRKMTDQGILTKAEDIVLKSTLNNIVVKKEDIPLLLEAFKEYDFIFPNSSLLVQAEIIENSILCNKKMIGVCWNHNSTISNPWSFDYDEAYKDIPYNIFKGKNHIFLTL